MSVADHRVSWDEAPAIGRTLSAVLEHVSFSWKSGLPPTLDSMDLEVRHGERLFIGGPSGSGKTTLLGLFSGILVPQSGTVELLQTRINTMSSAARDRFRADHIGYIHQMFNLVPYLSVLENVTLPCRFSRRRLSRAQRHSATASADAQRLLAQLGLDSQRVLRKPVSELSVGQQQRVAAARALIGSPELIIADEPTSALDAANREAFIELLFKECGETGATLVFVSHDTSLGPMFDRTVQLDGGAAC